MERLLDALIATMDFAVAFAVVSFVVKSGGDPGFYTALLLFTLAGLAMVDGIRHAITYTLRTTMFSLDRGSDD